MKSKAGELAILVQASLPSRERGLKYNKTDDLRRDCEVAPLAGAWIEIMRPEYQSHNHIVAPLAGAWIEILSSIEYYMLSHVAPLAGAWIEIAHLSACRAMASRRSPRGSVD